MLTIKFYNEWGQITFCGGGIGRWRLTAADGLALCGKNFKSVKYVGQSGQETMQAVANSRTITLSGDANTDGEFLTEYKDALAAFEKEGVLEISTVFGTRTIKARCCEFYQGEKKGKYMLFVVQFLCDDPYFEDENKVEVPIFKEVPLIDKNFAFPGTFSGRISRNNIIYEGNAETEPVFFINIKEVVGDDGMLSIVNHTSGEKLSFDYGGAEGESIVVDVKNREIYSSSGENLLKYLADDSFFDGFHLYPGVNDIEVINYNMNTGIGVTCSYSNRYSEAVYI